ncbi:hypothetical protein K470DRAFT_257586 [Piedraia hortae CBS 480.64]|uniref:Uncharacterized protein n=1 Tax=Piedraia hortae CBS 480.64 TaxID=1314780 RepID=A0A6A7C089_9PEZI|nr:hypothetical protein K470DRAFT_257586 [Piedraia hortae CBS 480.64]
MIIATIALDLLPCAVQCVHIWHSLRRTGSREPVLKFEWLMCRDWAPVDESAQRPEEDEAIDENRDRTDADGYESISVSI